MNPHCLGVIIWLQWLLKSIDATTTTDTVSFKATFKAELLVTNNSSPQYKGKLEMKEAGTSGDVFFDGNTIVIKNFTYDGKFY